MKIVKEKISDYRSRIEAGLRSICGRISPSRRVAVVVGLCLLFAIINIWSLVSAAAEMGHGDGEGRAIEVEHIEGIDSPKGMSADSLNTTDYERATE